MSKRGHVPLRRQRVELAPLLSCAAVANLYDLMVMLDPDAPDERRADILGSIETMVRLVERTPAIRRVNVGGIHHRTGRAQYLRYVFLTPDERDALRALAARGAAVYAQDVPSARPVPLADLLDARAGA